MSVQNAADGQDSNTDTGAANNQAANSNNADGGDNAAGNNDANNAGNSGDGKSGEGEGQESGGIPESYEFQMPEGVELDTAMAEKATPIFKELGLSQDQANKLTQLMVEAKTGEATAADTAFTNQLKQWESELKADKDFGGDNFDTNLGNVAKFIDKTVPEDLKAPLKEFLEDTGAGSNPTFVKYMHFLQSKMPVSEDGSFGRSGGSGNANLSREDRQKTRSDRMYSA